MKLNRRLLNEARQIWAILLLSICLGSIGGVMGILQARGISKLINQAFLGGKNLQSVSSLFILIFVVMLLRAAVSWGSELSSSNGARRIKQAFRYKLTAHLVDLGPGSLRGGDSEQGMPTGELVNTAIDGVEAMDAYYSQFLPQVALAVIIPLAILLFVFSADPLSGVVMLVTAPLLPMFMYLIGSTAENHTRKQWLGLSRMSAYFLDILQGLTTLKMFGRSHEQAGVILKVSDQYRQVTMDVLRVTFLSALVLELITTLSIAVVAVEIGIRLLYGRLAFEQAFFVLLLAPEFYLPLRILGMRFHAAMSGVEASRRIYQILDIPVNPTRKITGSDGIEAKFEGSPLAIEFKNVGFSYPGRTSTLDDISFTIPAGKITALTGESGVGKTTLTWFLLGLLNPDRGEIFINGKPLVGLNLIRWRESIAWVPQDPYLFDAPVAENIRMARPDATEAEVRQAASQAHADEFINRLPQGYATLIGERGARLSAGQAQRIALARAFLKDAPLLILDEATSHLDPELDAYLHESLLQLMGHRTVLLIAHQRSTLKIADQVITLDQGRVERISTAGREAHSTLSVQNQGNIPALSLYPTQSVNQAFTEPLKINTTRVRKRLVSLLSPFWGRITLSVLLGFATVASGVGLMATSAYIISTAALHPSIAELQIAIVGVRFFGLARGVFRYLERLVSHDVTFRLLARWRVWFYQALEPLAPARIRQYHSGDLLSRVIGDIGMLENFYIRAISPPLVALLTTLAITMFLGVFDARLSLVLLVFFAIAGLGLPWLVNRVTHQLGPQINFQRAQLSRKIIDCIQGLPDLLVYGQADAQVEGVRHISEQLSQVQKRMANTSAMHNSLGNLLASLGMLAVLGLSVQGVTQGHLDGVLIGTLALAAFTSFEAYQPLPLAAMQYEGNLAAASRLYELVDTVPAVNEPASPALPPDSANLKIQELGFTYPSQVGEPNQIDQLTLQDISFTLLEGKHIAIVGASGAGKTTLISLLLRFWDYQSGSILLDSNELRDYKQQDVRNLMAVISQNTYLFSATIRQNLLIARPGAPPEDLIAAARGAQLHDFIQSLPDGYDTWVGEHGLQLSAGQRQRLAIARALLKDAPLFLLDEPTVNLDKTNEQNVVEAISKITTKRSSITITQRMTDLRKMDEILVLHGGRVIEQGTHTELLDKKGHYWHMWELYNQLF